MRFYIETKVENGVEKIVTHSNPTDKRKALYRVMDEQGNKHIVEKQWLLTNKDNIVNLSVSGNSIRVKNSKQGKIKESVVKFSPEVEAVIEKRLSGSGTVTLKDFLYTLLPVVIEQKLKSVIASDIQVWQLSSYRRDGFCYGLAVTQNAYKFPEGVLSIKCDYDVVDNVTHNENKYIILDLFLLNQCRVSHFGMFGGCNYSARTLDTFAEKRYNVYDKTLCKFKHELVSVKRKFIVDNEEVYYVDEKQGRQLLLNIENSITQFIDTYKDIILSKLYVKESVNTVDVDRDEQIGCRLPSEVETEIAECFENYSSIDIRSVLNTLLPIVITQKLKSTIAPDIEVKQLGSYWHDDYCYSLKVSQNAYKFSKGVLSIKCAYIFDTSAGTGKRTENKFITLDLFLLNQCEETYLNNMLRTYTVIETLYNFVEKRCKIYDKTNCTPSWELEKSVKNMFRVDCAKHYYVDEKQGRQILLNIVKRVTQFIDTNKDIILNKLYLKDGVTTDDYKYKVVDKCHGYHFPDASKSIEKAEKLEKEGYTLYVNGTKMRAKQFKVKCQKDLGAGSYCMSGYSSVSEYVDKPKKAFYVLLGSVKKEDFYC